VTVGLDVAVEQDDLAGDVDARRQDGRRPVVGAGQRRAALDAVLLALDGAPVVPPCALTRRNGQVGLEGASLDLVEDALAQPARWAVRCSVKAFSASRCAMTSASSFARSHS
jgi:hypothetical protein